MDHNTENEQCVSKANSGKKDTSNINENMKVIDKPSDVETLKRGLPHNENEVRRKRRKKDDKMDLRSSTNNDTTALSNHIESKLAENSLESSKTEKLMPTQDNAKDNNEESDEENITQKQIDQLSGKYLRTSFNSASGLDTLRKFVRICNENMEKDMAAEYLNAGGNVLEILKLLGTADKKNIGTATTVFSAIRILLIKILAQYPQNQSSAEEACRHLLNSYLSLIHSMLSVQSNAKQRKVILRLLAAMVSLGGSLPRELLAHLSLHPQVVESLLRHTKPTDSQSIRTCFIHFVLAFLIEGKVPIIRALMDKRGLLPSIFPDLIYDSKDIVDLVLTTVRTYVLENLGISKTMKLHVFSTSVVQNLVNLYNWKGPKNWSKHKTNGSTTSPEFLRQKEVVTDIVHKFLLTLLSSHRYGIIFHDRMLGTSRVKHNQLVSTVLQSLDQPWNHDKPSNLVVNILAACPDLIKVQLSLVEQYIEPRVSIKWITLMKFVRQVIESVDPETCIRSCTLELNTLHFAGAIESLILPGTIMKKAVIPSLAHDSIIVRHEAILMLIVMFHKILNFSLVINTINGNGTDFKSYITEHITRNVPNLDMILNVWRQLFVPSSNTDNIVEANDILEPKKHEHLNATLSLLQAYHDTCPELLHAAVNLELNTLLSTLNELNDIEVSELNTIKVKAIRFLLVLDPTEFSPQKEIFRNTLSFLISLLSDEVSTISSYVKVTIKTLLNMTGLFEGCSDQSDIWINGFINITHSSKKLEVTEWFLNNVRKAARNTEKYVNYIVDIEETVNEQMPHVGKLEDVFSDLLDKDNTVGSNESNALHMQRSTSISPLLCCVMRKTKNNWTPTILSYMSYVIVHTLHSQVAPQCLIHLAKDIQELPVQNYLFSWLNSNHPVAIKEMFPCMAMMCKLSSVLLKDTKIELKEIFKGDNVFHFKYAGETITINHSLSAYEIMYLFKMTTFYLTQFTERGTLTEVQRENCTALLILLLHIAKENVDENSTNLDKCAMHIFTHPTILLYFSPLHSKHKDIMKNMITCTVAQICSVTVHLCEKRNIGNLFVRFKNKLLAQLHKMMKKDQRGDKLNDLEMITTLLELFKLTSQDIVCLLSKLTKLESNMFITKDKSDLSIFGHVTPKLLEIACSEELKSERVTFFKLGAEFVARLFSLSLSLKSNEAANVEKWETALWKYFSYFPSNIAGINASMFLSLLTTKITGATVKLISLLISKSTKLIPTFTDYVAKSEHMKESNIIFPIIESNLAHKWNQSFLQKLCKHYRSEIASYICDPKNMATWIEEHVAAVSYLIENTFDTALCEETCNNVLQIGDKLDMVSVHYILILQSIYNKYTTLKADSEYPVTNLIQVLLHVLTLTLKKESKNVEKVSILCEGLKSAVKRLKEKEKNFVLTSLSNNNSWSQFTRFSLKLGLKEAKVDNQKVPILKTLNTLCDIAYRNDDSDEYVKTLFEMATSHSEFINIMLGSSITKRDLIELLWILMQKNKTVMALTHVPLYLAAYNGTMSATDQQILFILQYYEKNNIRIREYRPYLWGNAAAVHYSVKGDTDMALWRQPTTYQVLSLFEIETVNNTIKHYPVDRALRNNELHETNDIYDPAFYLPLLCFLLSDNNVVSCHKITQSGALGLIFAACSSSHSDVRLAAYTAIARYYAHLEASSSKAKLLWMRLIDALRHGVISLESDLSSVRLSCLVSTFLAQTSLVATQPLNPLYSALQSFLMAKLALDVKAIPELLQLFHSSDVQHKAHRHWILQIIRDGMKTENDVEIAFKYVLFKMLLAFYTCNLSDSETKKLILEVIYATSKIPKASVHLMNGHGILPWLLEVTKNLQTHETQHFNYIVKITDNFVNAILHTKGEAVNDKFMILNIVLCLKSYLHKDVEVDSFTLYVNIINKLFASVNIKMMVKKEILEEILEFSKSILGNVDACQDMLLYGCEYISNAENQRSTDKMAIARNSLKTMVWTYCSR